MGDRNNNNTREQFETLMKLANHYRETGEDKLLEDIFETVRQQKKAGTLDNSTIKKMADGFGRFLNPEQRKKLAALTEALIKE